MSGTKEEALGYIFMELSSPRMLPCSLDTSFKKDIDGLQYDKQRKGKREKAQSPPPPAPLSASTSRLCLLQAWTPHGDLTPSSISTLVALSHPSSVPQPPVALPSCSFLSEHSVLFLPLPCCKL